MQPKILDLFAGAGGAAMGYHEAGFEVYGVDIEWQPDFPFAFCLGDAITILSRLLGGGTVTFTRRDGTTEDVRLSDFAAIHGSPPCQASCTLTKGTNSGNEYLNLIPATRALFALFGGPTVIENVQGSDLRRDLTLCGEMFGLGVIRHRYFECSGFTAIAPAHIKHRGRVAGWRHGEWFDGPYFAVYGEGGGKGTVEQWQDAMDMHWTSNRKSIAESIPKAYTRFIGGQIMQRLESEQAIRDLAA
ncbi:DNA cytosine methyltransferase [Pseudarthrobacter oxydans]|uniref:DNA cytosine methyltransferase n=1 Tax=Pseudarthrobacter oxydans TaxID=1671 RepID=UPI003440B5F3